MTHTFTKIPREHSSIDEAKVVVSTDAEHLSNVVATFEDYLRGCGFYFDGHLDFVDTGGGRVEHVYPDKIRHNWEDKLQPLTKGGLSDERQDMSKYRPDQFNHQHESTHADYYRSQTKRP